MKGECKTGVSTLHNTHCGCFSLSYICQALSNQLIFLQNTNFPHSPCILRRCQYGSRRIFTNILRSLTNVLRSTTNVLSSIKMANDCSRICCFSYQYKEHVSNLRKAPRMLTNTPSMLTDTYECLAIIANWRRIAFVSPCLGVYSIIRAFSALL